MNAETTRTPIRCPVCGCERAPSQARMCVQHLDALPDELGRWFRQWLDEELHYAPTAIELGLRAASLGYEMGIETVRSEPGDFDLARLP